MSFAEDVSAARAASAALQRDVDTRDQESSAIQLELALQQSELTKKLRARFDLELQELWRGAKKHWEENTSQISEEMAAWILNGHRLGSSEVLVPMPLIPFRVRSTTIGHSLAEAGFRINNWFALCEPGEIRDLEDQYGLVNSRAAVIEYAYRRVGDIQVAPIAGVSDGPVLAIRFELPSEVKPPGAIVITCGLEGPIQLRTCAAETWGEAVTLRHLLVLAVIDRLDNGQDSRPTA